MDLLAQSRCSLCDKLFCCPEHRRSHELLSHPEKFKKKTVCLPIERKQNESYALGMRRILYSEQNHSNFHKSRKRKYLTVSRIVHEQEAIELNLVNRKILVPRRKKNENPDYKSDEIIECGVEAEEIISPIEEKKSKDPSAAIFMTSTPLAKRGANFLSNFSPQISCQFSAPVVSIAEGITGILSVGQKDTIQITSTYQKRVTFSESVESLYNTASETALPENKPGILASVANAFQSAIQRIPGELTDDLTRWFIPYLLVISFWFYMDFVLINI
ncbi:uncharacterized protein [Halyomorpha halys]|uniref:uncharacterized protein isoform X2 n=1 Tax=Halyomorpha halys TaxID=286706 RepID=UPI0034D222E1